MKQVFLHGLGQTPHSWDKTIEYLGHTEDCVCPDLAELMHGKEATYDHLYAAFSRLCDKIDGLVELCGLSLGGVLALHYAIDHPQQVASLILIAAQYKMPGRLLRLQNIVFRLMPNSMFQQTGFGKAEFIRLCETMMPLDFSRSLGKISCPTLVLCGEKDSANRRSSARLADMIEGAELQIIGGAGHEVNVEAPEKLAEIIGSWRLR